MTVVLHHGDCRDVLATLPAESVQCVVTSPPYFGLRDYGTARWEGGDPACDHGAARLERRQSERQPSLGGGVPGSLRDKPVTACKCGAIRVDGQIGLEQSPQEYVEQLVAVFREVRRVLRKDGTAWLNLGDSYATQPGKGANVPQTKHPNNSYPSCAPHRSRSFNGLKPKDLMMIPNRVAIALQDDGWWVRSEIIWSKAAPMPESVRDRPTCAHEKVWLLTKSARYFYDADAVAEPANTFDRQNTNGMSPKNVAKQKMGHFSEKTGLTDPYKYETRNLRNVWHLGPEPYSGAHFATMPPTLAERCIKAGTSEKGCCPTCGAPWARVTAEPVVAGRRDPGGVVGGADAGMYAGRAGSSSRETVGWSPSCSCPPHEPVPQTVLDPFAGAGTTLLVADRLQRHGIGIELNPEYIAIAQNRLRGDAPLFAEVA